MALASVLYLYCTISTYNISFACCDQIIVLELLVIPVHIYFFFTAHVYSYSKYPGTLRDHFLSSL